MKPGAAPYTKKVPPPTADYPTRPNIAPEDIAQSFSAASPGPNFKHKSVLVDTKLNMDEWDQYSDIICDMDSTLLDNMRYGFCMGINRDCTVSIPYTNHKTAITEYQVIDDFVIKHCATGAIAGPYFTNPLPVKVHPSPLQVATSASGKKRAVIDMSYPRGQSINDAIPDNWSLIPGFNGQFRFPTHDLVCQQIVQMNEPVMFVADMAAWYMQLASDPADLPYLAFAWRGALYLHRRLPFGCRSSCLHAQRVTDAITAIYCRSTLYFMVGYVDDFCSIIERIISSMAYIKFNELSDRLGVERTPEKDQPPDILRVFLGLLYDLARRTLHLPEEKLRRVLAILDRWSTMESCNKQDIESLLGILNHVAVVVPAGRPFCASILDLLRTGEFPVNITAELIDDLDMWREFLSDECKCFVSMYTLVQAPCDSILAIACKQDSCIIQLFGHVSGYVVGVDLPKNAMYIVALWLVATKLCDGIENVNMCFAVPTKVVEKLVNRAAGVPKCCRKMVRESWLAFARLSCCVRALYQVDYVPWLYDIGSEFKYVHLNL